MLYRMKDAKPIKLGFNPFAKGFTDGELKDAFYRLTCDPKQQLLILESCSLEEADGEYGGDEPTCDGCTADCGSCGMKRDDGMVLEAVRVRAFSRTTQTMAALQRSLNKYMADKGITVGEAAVGKPKKSGLFATVTVQFPVSDGQTITIIFHSPDGNKLTITAAAEILAFRWLLNKRDITVAVAPEGEADVSLEEVGKRVAMLVEKNSKAFQSKSKEIADQKGQLADLAAQVATAQGEVAALQANYVELEQVSAEIDGQIEQTTAQLTKVQEFNAGLQQKIDELQAVQAGNAGKAGGEGAKTPEQIQTEADAAAFAEKKAAFEAELAGRGLSAEGEGFSIENPDGKKIYAVLLFLDKAYQAGMRYYPSTGASPEQKVFKTTTVDGLDKQTDAALAWIDKKLAAMPKPVGAVVDPAQIALNEAIADPIGHEIWTLPADTIKAMDSTTYDAVYGVLEDENYHTENVVLDAKRGGTAQDVADAEQIMQIADKEGSVSAVLSTWRDALRKWIAGTGTQEELDGAKAAALADPNADTDTNPDRAEENAALTILDAIVNGDYSTSAEMDAALDDAAAKLEALNMLGLYDDRLQAAADALTAKLQSEAAGV